MNGRHVVPGIVKVLGVDETEGATMLDQYWEMRMCIYY
jgi:hypothetical protein